MLFDRILARVPQHLALSNSLFMKEMGSGELSINKFERYLNADEIYLKHYQSALKTIAPRLDKKHQQTILNISKAIYNEEIDRRQKYRVAHKPTFFRTPSPMATQNIVITNYTNFFQHNVNYEPVEIALASLAACLKAYDDLGIYMTLNAIKENNRYAPCFDSYSKASFRKATAEMIQLVNETGEQTSAREEKMMGDAYITSAEYEYQFLQNIYTSSATPTHSQPVFAKVS